GAGSTASDEHPWRRNNDREKRHTRLTEYTPLAGVRPSAFDPAMTLRILPLILACLVAGCGTDDSADPVPQEPIDTTICGVIDGLCLEQPVQEAVVAGEARVGAPTIVVPSGTMPPEVTSLGAHNNLDIGWHDGRLWFAFRTAPSHFADPGVVMYVVSTTDLLDWRFEGKWALGTDVREPQFLSLDGKLLFYFAMLGTNPLAFEPQGARVVEYLGPGQWTDPAPVFPEDFIPWRIRNVDGRAEVLGYTGGGNIYELDDPQPIKIRWLASDDGRTWEPKYASHPVILEGGGSETDAAVLDDGRVIAVVRNEAGDDTGFGSKVCRGEADAPADWTCVADPRKYDSPLVFQQSGTVYLLGRRNVTDTGNYDLQREDLSVSEKFLAYQGDYWENPKRCALWTVDPDALKITHVLDLPSAGDTCFPEAIPLSGGNWLVFNYSSPWDEADDPTWLQGQWAPTSIYRLILSLP
ncbi:MAG: hypothetical protein ACI9WU_002597, partial [Myxococcota bacterium]